MSDEPLSSAPRVPVTAEFLAESRRKQAAYAESRRQYRERLDRVAWANETEDAPPPASFPVAAETPRTKRGKGKVIDSRQLKLEL